MALDQTVQVDLPKHGIAYKKISGKTYVYYVTAAYRNEKGKPTNDRVSIGRLDEETGKLIPNRNYYETYLKKPMPVTAGIQDFGVWDVFEKVCKKLGVTTLLRKYFPENAKEMLTAAQYILSEGNVMYYLDEYTQSHQTAGKGRMSNEQCSKTFASLRQEDMQLFFREWMKHKKQTEYVAYDVTSISSYSQNIREVEWGYNRDKERLPQINMGMYYGEESCLPLYYRVYPGSIWDQWETHSFRHGQGILQQGESAIPDSGWIPVCHRPSGQLEILPGGDREAWAGAYQPLGVPPWAGAALWKELRIHSAGIPNENSSVL